MAISRFSQSTLAKSKRSQQTTDALAGLIPLPYTPTIGTATDGGTGTTVSVAFTPNATVPPGTSYTALSSPGSITASGSASPITVSGLTSGTAYTFQVRASNATGNSAYSAASNSVTPVVPSSYESIATATGTGSSGTISFTSIPSTYTHLQVRILGRSDAAFLGGRATLRMNNDSGANYASHVLTGIGTGAGVAAAGNASATSIDYIYIVGASATANIMSAGVIDIHDYASTTKNKTVRILSGEDRNSVGRVGVASGLWQSTTAVNRLDIITTSGNWTTASTFALYGIKGA